MPRITLNRVSSRDPAVVANHQPALHLNPAILSSTAPSPNQRPTLGPANHRNLAGKRTKKKTYTYQLPHICSETQIQTYRKKAASSLRPEYSQNCVVSVCFFHIFTRTLHSHTLTNTFQYILFIHRVNENLQPYDPPLSILPPGVAYR